MECDQKSTCLFYNAYKNVYAAAESFIKFACGNMNIPCARRIWKDLHKSEAPENYTPAGTVI